MPFTWTDAKKREWPINLDGPTFKRIRIVANINLNEVLPKEYASDDEAAKAMHNYAAFLNDELRIMETLWAIVKPHADAKGITQEQFDEGFGDESDFQRAAKVFHAAFLDFSQGPRKTLLRGMAVGLKRIAKAQEKLNEITDEQIEAAYDEAESKLLETSKTPALESPVALGSAPTA